MQVLTARQMFEKYEHALGNEDDYLWGPHIRNEAITLFVGETSVGKTTFLFNLCYRLSRGESFLNIAPSRPLRILHIDYESYGGVWVENAWKVGYESDTWCFPDFAQELKEEGHIPRGPAILRFLDKVERGQYDIIIVDPLLEAYPVANENDNAEAATQMIRFRELARSKNVGMVLVHNTGHLFVDTKNPTGNSAFARASKKHMGRGATARQDKADIGINYVKVDETTRILQVVKSRTSNIGTQWVLSFDGDHGLAVRELSHLSQVSQTLPPGTDGTLTEIVQQHPGESLRSIYEQYVKGQLGISKSTFFRKIQAIRNQQGPPLVSPKSEETCSISSSA